MLISYQIYIYIRYAKSTVPTIMKMILVFTRIYFEYKHKTVLTEQLTEVFDGAVHNNQTDRLLLLHCFVQFFIPAIHLARENSLLKQICGHQKGQTHPKTCKLRYFLINLLSLAQHVLNCSKPQFLFYLLVSLCRPYVFSIRVFTVSLWFIHV